MSLVWPVNGPAQGFRPAAEVVLGSVPNEVVSIQDWEVTLMSDEDEIVGVTMLFAPDGSPESVKEITRTTALGSLFAFELALAADDDQEIVAICKAMYEGDGGTDPMVTRHALMYMLTSVVRPALTLLGSQADPLRALLRRCADEFGAMLD